MTQGASGIPDLRLQRLNKLITRFTTPPELLLMNLFGSDTWESAFIKWESQIGNRGMTPFVAPGAPAPSTAPPGLSEQAAMAAFWKEKIYYDESFLNNIRQEGTVDQYLSAQKRLARDMKMLRGRADRRKEWMFGKMISEGSFSYVNQGGFKISVNYNIPSDQIVTLAAARQWDTGASRNPVEDIMDAKIALSNACGAVIDYALITSDVLKVMVLDTAIQTLLAKSAYGQGDLFAQPAQVLGNLVHIPNLVVYDQMYQIRANLTTAVAANGGAAYVIYVDDVSDFEAGDTLRFVDVSAKTYEDEVIQSIDANAGTITLVAGPSVAFNNYEDYVYANKKFLPEDRFVMFASSIEGQSLAQFADAPFSIPRQWGIKVDSKVEWDPEGVYIRVQNKGLPVLYQSDGVYILDVM
jgi:hypothetical protein